MCGMSFGPPARPRSTRAIPSVVKRSVGAPLAAGLLLRPALCLGSAAPTASATSLGAGKAAACWQQRIDATPGHRPAAAAAVAGPAANAIAAAERARRSRARPCLPGGGPAGRRPRRRGGRGLVAGPAARRACASARGGKRVGKRVVDAPTCGAPGAAGAARRILLRPASARRKSASVPFIPRDRNST